MFTMADGLRSGRCLDGESLDHQPGGPVHVYPCTKRWNQYLSFGDGLHAPAGSIHTTIPLHTRKRILETGREQPTYMCLGVAGRGDLDEEDWFDEREDFDGEPDEDKEDIYDDENDDVVVGEESDEEPEPTEREDDEQYRPLLYWMGKQLMATQCGNEGAVIEWLLVPFILEDEEDPQGVVNATNATGMENKTEHGDSIIFTPDDDEEL